MTEAIAQSPPRHSPFDTTSVWRVTCAVFAAVSLSLFLFLGARYLDETQRELRLLPWLPYDMRVDFGYFFAGADMAWHGDAAELYPAPGDAVVYPPDPIFESTPDDYDRARLLARGNYYNPPALAYLQSPLTAFDYRTAFWLFTGLSVASVAGYGLLAWRAGRGVPELAFLLLGVITFKAVHETLVLGHLTLFFVLVLAAGFLALRAERQVLAGLVFSLLALKPQWAVLPALFLLVRGEWRSLGVMAAGAAAIFFLPFFATGFQTLSNYYHFLRQAAEWDLWDAPHMFSWNGFLLKLDDRPPWFQGGPIPDPTLIYALIALTVLPLAVVWAGRDFLLGVAATVIAMLLVSTHSVWYDWALLAVAALFLVLRPMGRGLRVQLWVVLLALYVATAYSTEALLRPDRHFVDWQRPELYPITPIAFAALMWIAALTVYEGRLKGLSLRLPPRR